jgi:Mlc titration factor MtfA (ptsG expression regulator)
MFSLIFSIVAVIILIFRHKDRISHGYGYANRVAAPLKTYVLPVPQQYRDILAKYFPYYQKLSPRNKARFELKVTNFIYGKRFIPRNVDEVTIEAKVLIAASAVQLTFGLPNVYLRHFNKILVYPDNYYSSITRRYHKGEVNPRFGIIVLSWQAFIDGYINQHDSINLGLHEMAHALRLEDMIRSEEFRIFDEKYLDEFDTWAEKICEDAGHGAPMFFRPYACTNKHEFFSVAIENFFERPRDFKQHLPQLYDVLAKLLRQDLLMLQHTE